MILDFSPTVAHFGMSARTPSEGTMVPHEDVDVEKKEEEVEPCKPAMPEFPEGGWVAWGVVLGSWLGSESWATACWDRA